MQLMASVQDTVTCMGGRFGRLQASVSCGQPPFTYAWSSGDSTRSTDSLIAGKYFVTVTDNSGATISTSVVLPEGPCVRVKAQWCGDTLAALGIYITINGATNANGYEYQLIDTAASDTIYAIPPASIQSRGEKIPRLPRSSARCKIHFSAYN